MHRRFGAAKDARQFVQGDAEWMFRELGQYGDDAIGPDESFFAVGGRLGDRIGHRGTYCRSAHEPRVDVHFGTWTCSLAAAAFESRRHLVECDDLADYGVGNDRAACETVDSSSKPR